MTLFWRVIVSFVYDVFIIMALSVLLSACFTLFLGAGFHEQDIYRWSFDLTWLAMVMGYFAVSWRFGGQTIGMKAWRLAVLRDDTSPLLWSDVLRRLSAGTLNALLLNLGWLGYLTLHPFSLTDRWSHTYVNLLAKNEDR